MGDGAKPLSKSEFLRSVVLLHGQRLTRFFATWTSEPPEAQDLMHEVYLRILKLERPDLIRDEHTYQEISERLPVPQHRVRKYLAKALAHCREHLVAIPG